MRAHLTAVATLVACQSTTAPAPEPSTAPPPAATATSPGVTATPPPPASAPPAAPEPAAPNEPPPPTLPDGVEPGTPVVIPVEGDRPIHVIHAPAQVERCIVYLHGVCGDIYAVRPWADAVAPHATLVALHGDSPCAGGQRFKWTSTVTRLVERIDRAVGVVATKRDGLLDTEAIPLFGYSQGATRAVKLAAEYPERFPILLLGGFPGTLRAGPLQKSRGVALIGGQHEPQDRMKQGVESLSAAGVRARFFELPGASHGQYGKDASRVLAEAFTFVFGASD